MSKVCIIETEKIVNGAMMFYNCSALTAFKSDLPALTNGSEMFYGCSKLTTFDSDLSSLTNGNNMFQGCKLDAPSVKNICLTINKNITNSPDFWVGVNTSIMSNSQVKKDLGLIKYKGWKLYVNGSNSTSNYTLPKYAGCTNVTQIETKNPNYDRDGGDIVNGVWGEHLPDLTDGTGMFWTTSRLYTFTADLSSLTNGTEFISNCRNLSTFTSDLSKLKNGTEMFSWCTSLATFTHDLPSLEIADQMFQCCEGLTTFDTDLSKVTSAQKMFYGCEILTSVKGDLSSLTNGTDMFYDCPKLKTLSTDLSSLTNGEKMFYRCYELTAFSINLPSLTNGEWMFKKCTGLTTVGSNLSKVTNGTEMFYQCSALTAFNSDLPSLTEGDSMFAVCTALTTFDSNLSKVTNGTDMFAGCTKLTTFNSDLSSLKTGNHMFDNCINLTTFNSNLGSLTSGRYMFQGCKLNANSIKNIVNTIKTTSSGTLVLGINVTNDATTIQQQLEDFAIAASFASWADLKKHFKNKGWSYLTFQYGGTTTKFTYDLRNQIIPCPIYAKLVEVSEEDKDLAQYCNEDGSRYYDIEWGHDVTDTDSYTMFDSLEDAMTSWNVFPKENIITSEEEIETV